MACLRREGHDGGFWPVLLGLVRTAYLTYSLWCWMFPLALSGGLLALWLDGRRNPWLFRTAWALLAMYLLASAYAVLFVYQRKHPTTQPSARAPFCRGLGR